MDHRKLSTLLLVLLIVCTLAACGGECVDIEEVKNNLYSKLNIGASREEIEASLTDIGIQFTYDKFQNRYQAAITEGCSAHETVIVLLIFDDTNKLSKVKVFKEYTWW